MPNKIKWSPGMVFGTRVIVRRDGRTAFLACQVCGAERKADIRELRRGALGECSSCKGCRPAKATRDGRDLEGAWARREKRACAGCRRILPRSEWDARSGNLAGYPRARCRACESRRPGRQQTPEKASAMRAKVVEALGGRCACCGESHSAFLHIDHVNNDGGAERARIRNQSRLYRQVLRERDSGRYQVLCANCNHAKAVHGVCPHQRGAMLGGVS